MEAAHWLHATAVTVIVTEIMPTGVKPMSTPLHRTVARAEMYAVMRMRPLLARVGLAHFPHAAAAMEIATATPPMGVKPTQERL